MFCFVWFSVAEGRAEHEQGRDASDAQRPPSRAERRPRSRQVQDAQADPPGQHQAASRPVRVDVTRPPAHSSDRPHLTPAITIAV